MNISRRDFFGILAGTSLTALMPQGNVFAAESDGPLIQSPLIANDIDQISKDVAGIRAQANEVCLTDINFDNLSIANGIPTYTFSGESLREEPPYFPVFDGERLVLLVTESEHGVQITNGLVSELRDFISSGEEVAIVYDRTTAYLYRCSDSTYVPLISYAPMPGRGDIISTPSLSIETASLIQFEEISALPSTRAASYSLAVPVVRQPTGSSICWAACCASIANYKLGTGYSSQGVASLWYGLNYDRALPSSDSAKVLKTLGLSYTHYPSALNTTKITNNLSKGYPIYGCWSYGSGTGHATVIRGITSTNSLSLMDPLTSSFTTASYSNGLWWARSAGTGSQMHLERTTCRYA